MHMTAKFSEPGVQAVIGLLSAIHTAMGRLEYSPTPDGLGPERLLQLAESLRGGKYQPADWFRKGTPPPTATALTGEAPKLQAGTIYQTILDPIEEASLRTRSVGAGGMVFEDPFYALLACYNATLGKPDHVMPFAKTYKDLWRKRPAIVQAVRTKAYNTRVETYFAPAPPPPANQPRPPLQLLTIRGDQLEVLRESAAAVFTLDKSRGLAQYRLFFFDLAP
jgi:hypothetical protein